MIFIWGDMVKNKKTHYLIILQNVRSIPPSYLKTY